MLDLVLNMPLLQRIKKHIILYEKLETLWPLLWMGFNCLKAAATARRHLLFTTKCSVVPDTHLMNFDEM